MIIQSLFNVPHRLRLMLLKNSNEWGYETLEYQVNQNLILKKFCRIPLDKPALIALH